MLSACSECEWQFEMGETWLDLLIERLVMVAAKTRAIWFWKLSSSYLCLETDAMASNSSTAQPSAEYVEVMLIESVAEHVYAVGNCCHSHVTDPPRQGRSRQLWLLWAIPWSTLFNWSLSSRSITSSVFLGHELLLCRSWAHVIAVECP